MVTHPSTTEVDVVERCCIFLDRIGCVFCNPRFADDTKIKSIVVNKIFDQNSFAAYGTRIIQGTETYDRWTLAGSIQRWALETKWTMSTTNVNNAVDKTHSPADVTAKKQARRHQRMRARHDYDNTEYGNIANVVFESRTELIIIKTVYWQSTVVTNRDNWTEV